MLTGMLDDAVIAGRACAASAAPDRRPRRGPRGGPGHCTDSGSGSVNVTGPGMTLAAASDSESDF